MKFILGHWGSIKITEGDLNFVQPVVKTWRASRGRNKLMLSISGVLSLQPFCSLSVVLCAWEGWLEAEERVHRSFLKKAPGHVVCETACCNVTNLDTTFHHLHLKKRAIYFLFNRKKLYCWAKAGALWLYCFGKPLLSACFILFS